MSDIRRSAVTLRWGANLVVLALLGAAAYREWLVFLPQVHGAIFTGGSVVGGVLLGFGLQVFGKVDRLLMDWEKYDYAKVERVYKYLGALRRRLVFWLLASFASLVAMAAVAYLLKESTSTNPSLTVPARLVRAGITSGYVGLTIVLLAGIRTVTAYLGLDEFRLSLLKVVAAEESRRTTLEAMRDPRAIAEFTDDAPSHVGHLRSRQA